MIKKIDKIKLLENIILILFFIGTFFIMSHHELWRDEAQQWLLIKSLNFKDLFLQLKIEGHPIVWYLLLKIYCLFGGPYQNIGFISWVLSSISAFLVVKKFDLNLFVKMIIIFSFPFAYIGPVLCRSYSLVMLEVIILILLYPKRNEKPIIYNILLALITNTHVLTLGFTGSLYLLELYDLFIKKQNSNFKRQTIGIFLATFGFIILIIQLFNPNNIILNHSNIDSTLLLILYNFIIFFTKTNINFIFQNIGLFCFIWLIICLFNKKDWRPLFILTYGISFQLFVHTFIYPFSYYMAIIFYLILLFILMLISERNKQNSCLLKFWLIIIFAVTISQTFQSYYIEYKYAYTTSNMVANFINENIPKTEKIYCDNPSSCSSIKPYINNVMIDGSNKQLSEFTYIDWAKRKDGNNLSKTMIENIKNNGGKYVIICYYQQFLDAHLDDMYDIIFDTRKTPISFEKYIIIQLK